MAGRRFIRAVFACLALVLALPLTVSAQAAPGAVVDQFVAAVTAHDIAGALALFADEATVQSLPCTQLFGPTGCIGKAQIQKHLEASAAAGQQGIVLTGSVSGNTVTQTIAISNPQTTAAGVQRILVHSTFVVQDGKIVSQRSALDSSDPQTAAYIAYVQAHTTQLPKTGAGTAGRNDELWLSFLVLVGMACLGVGTRLRWLQSQ